MFDQAHERLTKLISHKPFGQHVPVYYFSAINWKWILFYGIITHSVVLISNFLFPLTPRQCAKNHFSFLSRLNFFPSSLFLQDSNTLYFCLPHWEPLFQVESTYSGHNSCACVPSFLPSRPHKYMRKRNSGPTRKQDSSERSTAESGTKTAKSYYRRDERRMRSTEIRDFKTNISRVNPAWMYVSLLPGDPWLYLPERRQRRETPRGKRAEQITDVLLYIFPAESSQPFHPRGEKDATVRQ